MRRHSSLIATFLLAVLVTAVTAHASNVTVNAAIAGGSTLSVSSLNAPSFNLTLNGDDQTASYQAQVQVVDARGLATGGGWNLTITSTQFVSGTHTFPANASTISSVSAACHTGSTCALATNSVANSNLALPISPTTTKFLNAASGSGLGRIDININVNVAVPANTLAGTYSSTLTVSSATGP